MSYKTVEVELENGFVRPTAGESLPAKARALLTVLDGTLATPPTGAELAKMWAEIPKLPPDEAEAFARDIEQARRELPPLKSPWD